jgi:hypothetical protein
MKQHKQEAPTGSELATKKTTWPLERILFAMGGTVTPRESVVPPADCIRRSQSVALRHGSGLPRVDGAEASRRRTAVPMVTNQSTSLTRVFARECPVRFII